MQQQETRTAVFLRSNCRLKVSILFSEIRKMKSSAYICSPILQSQTGLFSDLILRRPNFPDFGQLHLIFYQVTKYNNDTIYIFKCISTQQASTERRVIWMSTERRCSGLTRSRRSANLSTARVRSVGADSGFEITKSALSARVSVATQSTAAATSQRAGLKCLVCQEFNSKPDQGHSARVSSPPVRSQLARARTLRSDAKGSALAAPFRGTMPQQLISVGSNP